MDILHRVVFIVSLTILGFASAGTKACTDNYNFATQTKITTTETATPSETDNGVVTVTPGTATGTPEITPGQETPTPIVPTPTPVLATPTTSTGLAATGLMADLRSLSDSSGKGSKSQPPSSGDAVTQGQSGSVTNWLGQIGKKDKAAEASAQLDSDKDGYMDWLEVERGTDPVNPQSVPSMRMITRLNDRLAGVDDDADGLSEQEEDRIGTDPNKADTDGDGTADGAEVLSGANPLNADSKPDDTDHDGLSDDYETSIGTNPLRNDTDGDGLSDNLEVSLATNPRDVDTDRDGIADGREVALGTDPLRPDQQ